MPDAIRPAPRLAISPNSLAALHAALTSSPSILARLIAAASTRATALRSSLGVLEPWYDWGRFGITRMDYRGEGDVWHFEVDWLGLHLLIAIGRTPRATLSAEEAFAWAR